MLYIFFIVIWYPLLGCNFFLNFRRNSLKNEEKTRHRMKDAIASVINEECYGMQYAEWAWGPHDFHYNRLRGLVGYRNPDDPRVNKILIIRQWVFQHSIERISIKNIILTL